MRINTVPKMECNAFLQVLSLLLLLWITPAWGDSSQKDIPLVLGEKSFNQDIMGRAQFYRAHSDSFPIDYSDVESWINNRDEPVEGINSFDYFGDAFWMVLRLKNRSDYQRFVIHPYSSVIEHMEFRFYSSVDMQSIITGAKYPTVYDFHYGDTVELVKGGEYYLVSLIKSDYFYAPLKLQIKPETLFKQDITIENMVMMLCFGIGLALAIYNFFLFLGSRTVSHLYYSMFVLSWMFAWSHFFHMPMTLFGVYAKELHWPGFLLCMFTNIIFYNRFLHLPTVEPRLSKVSMGLAYLGLCSIPLVMENAGFGLLYVSAVTAVAFVLALYIGINSWKKGFKPAKYFVLAYLAMALPNFFLGLTNLGLAPHVNVSLYLLGLIGITLDALLLAFALAFQIRILYEKNRDMAVNLESKVDQRTQELSLANDGLKLMASELKEANRAKDRFFANMSHEIRTPLTSIIGYADSLLSNETPEEQRNKAINSISGSGRYLLQLINDILDLSKMEEGQLDIESMDVCLPDLLRDVTTIVSHKAEKKDIKFHLDVQYPIVDRVLTDPTRLKQILINLCSNAVKFTEKGSVSVVVIHTQDCLSIEVKDSGIGMSDAQQANLFKPFVQADASISRRFGGTGLGLYLSQLLAKKLGGEISVKSVEGVGSSFALSIYAPMAESFSELRDDEAFKRASCSAKPAAASSAGKLYGDVLLAEDHPENNELISLILRSSGLNVVSVFNGKEAIRETEKKKFDIILMDVQMPLVDGVQATKEIRATDKSTPIIALTANVMKHEVEEYLTQGFDDHLAKPIDRNVFFERIGYYLSAESKSAASVSEVEGNSLAQLQKCWKQLREGIRAADKNYCGRLVSEIHAIAEHLGFSRLSSVSGQFLKDKEVDFDKISQLQELLACYFELTGVDFDQSSMAGYVETIHDSLVSYTDKNKDVKELIHEGMTPRHFPLVVDILNSIKSFSGNLGAVKLRDCCLELERLLHGNGSSPEVVDEAVLKFHRCFEELNQSAIKLKRCLKGLGLN
ncbi:MAG: response regulator [Cellvibrionaceae bacterium]